MTAIESAGPGTSGANAWLVEEMYEQFRSDPGSVSETWQEFFADYNGRGPSPRGGGPTPDSPARPPCPATAAGAAATPPPRPPGFGSRRHHAAPAPRAPADDRRPLRGAGAAIAANMERSLTVPTATSFRNIPAKLLEVNRKVINGYRSRSGQGKVSFTHLIGYAVVRAIADARARP